MNILIVDDHALNREVLRMQLEAEGHRVLEATHGIEALEILDRESVDGVVSDILMPGMDGFQLCLEIRKRKNLARLPFIFYTGTFKSPQDREFARTIGADQYLIKPSTPREILGALEQAMQRTRDRIAVSAAQHDETYVLKQYNEALVRKLGERNLELEAALKQLQAAHREVHESEGQLRLFVEHAPAAIAMVDREMNYLAVSRRWLADYRLGERDITGRNHYDVFPEIPERWKEIHRRCLAGAVEKCEEDPFPRADGSTDWVRWEIHPWRKDGGEIGGIILFSELITERKLQQQRIERLSRIRALSSGINAAIVRVRERSALLKEICRIASEHGKFEMIWIGTIDHDKREVRPVAWTGFSAETANAVSWASISSTKGTLGEAMLTRKASVRDDIETQLPAGKLREEALEKGYRSTVCLPLVVDDRVTALVVLFATGQGFFDKDELALLDEVASDISFALQTIDKQDKLDYLSYYDVLTGLPNRTLFVDHAGQQMRERGGEPRMVALVLLNIERFRYINESLGRHGGDALLKQVAQRLETAFHGKDYLARISADSFGVVIRGIRDAEAVVHAVESQVLGCFREPYKLVDSELRVTAKAGIALFPADGGDADTLFKNAEAALKRARESGNRYLFYAADMNARAAHVLALETRLRKAVEAQQFVLHYQPKIELANDRIYGLEALIRWQEPGGELVVPGAFIPLLEETSLILEVGKWAIEQALVDHREWAARGCKVPRIAVNVSAIQLQQKDFADMVINVVQEQGGGLDALELEVTESLLMKDVEGSIRKLSLLRGLGIHIAMDDFGTGYSSLSYIARLPINSVKIDRSFINGMANSPQDMAIVTTIIALAHSLNLRVVAEGVETESQSKLLKLLKCDEAQGYLFSKPLPAAEIEPLLRTLV